MIQQRKWSKKRRVSEILARKNSKYDTLRKRFLSFNLFNKLSAFTTRKYHSKEYQAVFEYASLEQISIKQACLIERFRGRKCPSPEQVMKCCRKITSERMTKFVNRALKAQFNALPKGIQQQFKTSGTLIIDFHQDCYYGDSSNPYVRIGKVKKSTNLFYEYITADLYCKHGCFTISLFHRPSGVKIVSLVEKVLYHVKTVISPKIVLFDGEFAVIDVLNLLKHEGLKYLGRKSRTPRVMRSFQGYKEDSNWKQNRKWHLLEMMSRKRRQKTVMVEICPQNIHGTMKALVKSPGWQITPTHADKLYKMRFNIETGYRDKHEFQLFTCTKILSTRLLFFLVSIQAWNCWQCFLIWVRSLKCYSQDLPRNVLVQLSIKWIKLSLKKKLIIPEYSLIETG